MKNKIKNGAIALGLAFLLGCTTPVLAKDTGPKKAEAQEQQGPSFAYSVITEETGYSMNVAQNDSRNITLMLDYSTTTLFGNIPYQNRNIIVLKGKKQGGSVKLEEMQHSNGQITAAYKENSIDYVTKGLAEKILTEKAEGKPETEELMYDFLNAINADKKEI